MSITVLPNFFLFWHITLGTVGEIDEVAKKSSTRVGYAACRFDLFCRFAFHSPRHLHRNSWAKTPSKSLEKRSNSELRELLANYAKTTIEKVKSWKHSRDQMMKRLIREVDERARKNRTQYKNTKKLDI